jgi:hypothetical protein
VALLGFSPWNRSRYCGPVPGGSPEPSFAFKHFIETMAAICVSSTEEVLIRQQPTLLRMLYELGQELSPHVSSGSRSRFFLNTVGTYAGSSTPRPANQRQSKL